MSNAWDEIEEFVRTKKQAAAQQEQVANTDARFDKLEEQMGTLADGVSRLVESSSRSESPATPEEEGAAAPSGGESGGAAPEKSKPEPEENLPVEEVTHMDVPRIYTGDDEPTEVAYIDGPTGETKTRPGRRKGHPTVWNVAPYEAPENVPTEEVA